MPQAGLLAVYRRLFSNRFDMGFLLHTSGGGYATQNQEGVLLSDCGALSKKGKRIEMRVGRSPRSPERCPKQLVDIAVSLALPVCLHKDGKGRRLMLRQKMGGSCQTSCFSVDLDKVFLAVSHPLMMLWSLILPPLCCFYSVMSRVAC